VTNVYTLAKAAVLGSSAVLQSAAMHRWLSMGSKLSQLK
jgi:hypothetical protein